MDHGLEEQKRIIPDLLKLAGEFQLRVVATNDVHYVDAGDNVAHDAMLCIQTGARLADERRMRYDANGVLPEEPGRDAARLRRGAGGDHQHGRHRRDVRRAAAGRPEQLPGLRLQRGREAQGGQEDRRHPRRL